MPIDGIWRYRALKSLQLLAVRGVNEHMFGMLRGMTALREIGISEDTTPRTFLWSGLIIMLELCHGLAIIRLKALWP